MKGRISFYAKNNHICFKFELDRNVTIITGDSGTGKTKLINMVRAYSEEGKSSGVTLKCSCSCYVLEGKSWEMQLENISKSVVFIDGSSKFVSSKDFAEAIMKTDNYYVLVTREPLPQIAYSIYSIKRIIKNGRNPKVEKVYNNVGIKDITKIKYDVIIVEDAKSCFQFFTKVGESLNTICISAEGKSNILNKLRHQNATKILVVADADAFGSEIYELIYYIETNNVTVDLFLPESFE